MSEEQIKRYINTPFAYTRAQKGLTLLQQNIMVRVSAHLQGYINKFFQNPALLNSNEDPKPIMTKEDRDNLPPVRIELSELGVASSSYSRVREALREILSVDIEYDDFDENGLPLKVLQKLFSCVSTPVTDHGTTVRMKLNDDDEELTEVEVDRTRGFVELTLNTDAIWRMFDMNQGYVSHPVDIARIGKVDNMPLMYYFIRHKMKNFKESKAQATLMELRDYLGAIKRDLDGNIIKIQYQKYSRFKERIINTALNDIKRVCDRGEIDFYFEMDEIRPNGKKIGDPSYLVFRKVANKKKAEKDYRKASELKLYKYLLEQYPFVSDKALKKFLHDVPKGNWESFKEYVYHGAQKLIEKPHRWNGTQEEYVFYVLSQWVEQHEQSKVQQPKQLELFGEEVSKLETIKIQTEVGQGADKWQEFARLVIDDAQKSLLARLSFVGMKNERFCIQCSDEDFAQLRTSGLERVAQGYFGCVGSFAPVFYRG